MELSDVIKSLEDVKDQIRKRVTFHKYVTIVRKLNDIIAELKEVEYERLNDIITLHLQQNNSELISRCILKQPENSSKTQTWKEFCEEENKRRIEDLEKENKRIREEIQKEIQKMNNDWCSFVATLSMCVAYRGGDENEPLT